MKNQCAVYLSFFAFAVILLTSPQIVPAAIIIDPNGTGATNVDPAEPGTWTSDTNVYIGKTASGELLVDAASEVESDSTLLGDKPGSTGILTIDGIGSKWTSSFRLDVGSEGSGTLNITNGGAVSNIFSSISSTSTVMVDGIGSTWASGGLDVNGTLTITNSGSIIGSFDTIGSTGTVTVDGINSTWTNNGLRISGILNVYGSALSVSGSTCIDPNGSATGSIHFGDSCGTLTTESLSCSSSQFTGTGTINTHGLVSDVDLIFDATHGQSQTLFFNGPGQNITVNLNTVVTSYDLGAGYQGNGSLAILDGVVISSSEGYLGYHLGAVGTTTVSGPGSTWTNSSGLYVGRGGSGSLNITNGGVVSNSFALLGNYSGSTGFVTVDGAGSKLINNSSLNVGCEGSGTLCITNRGAVSDRDGSIGFDSIVTVDGIGSTWTNSSDLNINGILGIADCGAVSSSNAILGNDIGSSGTVTVNGPGSTWTNRYSLSVGNEGNGMLEITNGGTVNSAYATLGDNWDSTGIVTVDGPGSTWTNDGELYVGHSSYGMLDITNAGAVTCSYDVYLGYWGVWPTDNTTVEGSGSVWTDDGDLEGAVGTVMVDGVGSTLTNNSHLCVGYGGCGTLTITDGGLVSVAGTLTIDYENNSNSSINMATGGMLALQCNAENSLLDFFEWIEGMDAINYWDDSISDWLPITGATSGTDYTLEYLTEGELAGYTVLTVGTVSIPGDANGDGLVDGSDVTILAGNWQFGVDDGQTATWAMGDFNGDGQVDGSDVTILAGNWQYGVEAAATAVPEPGCVALLLMLVLAVGFGYYFSNRNVCRCVSCSSSGKRI